MFRFADRGSAAIRGWSGTSASGSTPAARRATSARDHDRRPWCGNRASDGPHRLTSPSRRAPDRTTPQAAAIVRAAADLSGEAGGLSQASPRTYVFHGLGLVGVASAGFQLDRSQMLEVSDDEPGQVRALWRHVSRKHEAADRLQPPSRPAIASASYARATSSPTSIFLTRLVTDSTPRARTVNTLHSWTSSSDYLDRASWHRSPPSPRLSEKRQLEGRTSPSHRSAAARWRRA